MNFKVQHQGTGPCPHQKKMTILDAFINEDHINDTKHKIWLKYI